MIRNYFKTAWRNLIKNKFYSVINIVGLAIGLAVGIIILLWVQDELSYDNFHRNADNIYKINSHFGKGADEQIWDAAPAPLSIFCKQIPEVINSVRIKARENQLLFIYHNKKFLENTTAFTDPSFFTLFDFKMVKGNNTKPFNGDNSIVITSSVAKKYFGTVDAVGKILTENKESFVVSGVLEDFPQNSNFQYNMLFPMSLFAKNFRGNGSWKTIDEDLGNYQYKIYLQLRQNASIQTVSRKLSEIFNKNKNSSDNLFTLQPLKTLHLIAADGNTSALKTVRIFLIVAILILFIACVNYVNLSTARSMLRSKEVSVRKIIGAAKLQLFTQFIVETTLLFVLASLLAFILIYFLLPLSNQISGKQISFSLNNSNVWLIVGSAIIGTLVLASIYPALLLSSFKPIQALKGKLLLGVGTASFRKILVVTQFVFSVCLIIATIVIGRQLQYIRNKDLGFNKEHVFSFSLTKEMHDHSDAAKNELLKQPGVLDIAFSDNTIAGDNGGSTGDTNWEGKQAGKAFFIHQNCIDEHFIPMLKIQLLQGNNFTGSKADSAHFILNETAVKEARITDPIGKSFTLWNKKGTIIGVVKDVNFASLKQKVEPSIFYYEPPNWRMYIKTKGKDASLALTAAQKVWKEYNSEFPFDYSFLDEDFGKMYQAEERTGALFNAFAAIAIAISCLGLFGLATYTAEVKIKEIGIRKVLGASVINITNLLAKEFILLVFIAFIIATPVSYWMMNQWLQDFAYRTSISWWIFIFTGLSALVIALLTISFQAIKAALANPVKSLRSE